MRRERDDDRQGFFSRVQGFLLKSLWGRFAIAGCVFGALGFAFAQPSVKPRREITLRARAVPLSAIDPKLDQTGEMRFMGGLWLTSEDRGFGGLSGIVLEPDANGFRLIGVTDDGNKFSAHVSFEAGRLKDVDNGVLEPLLDLESKAVSGKAFGDSESIARLRDGRVLVGFERNHRIWAYGPGLTGPASVFETPTALAQAPSNGGLESLASWPDGRLLAITEQMKAPDGNLAAFLFQGDQWSNLSWKRSADAFEPSDATVLPNGDLLILERFWTALAPTRLVSRVMRVKGDSVKPGAVLRGESIGQLTPPLTSDNFEGITAFTNAGGRTQLLLVSDDNFNAAQRTLLMSFELRP